MFWVLQLKKIIIQNPCRLWQIDAIYDVMMCCVILHNMIIEDEWDQNLDPLFDEANVAHSKKVLTFQ